LFRRIAWHRHALPIVEHRRPGCAIDRRARYASSLDGTALPGRSATRLNEINEYSPLLRLPDTEGCPSVTTYRRRSVRRASFPTIGRGWVVRTKKGTMLKSTPIAGLSNSRGEPNCHSNRRSNIWLSARI